MSRIVLFTHVEGGGDYVGRELWDNDGRGSSVEEEWDNKRRVAVIRNEGSEATSAGRETDEDAGGYVAVYATLGG